MRPAGGALVLASSTAVLCDVYAHTTATALPAALPLADWKTPRRPADRRGLPELSTSEDSPAAIL